MDCVPEPPAEAALVGGVGKAASPPQRPASATVPVRTPGGDEAPSFEVEIVDTVTAMDRFEDFHRRHHAHPESHFDLLRAAMQNGRAAEPFFVMVSRDGEPCLLLVAQFVRGRLPWRLGYRTIHASRARTIEVLQGGWFGDRSRPCLEYLRDQVYAFLRRGGADAIHLRHVPAESDPHQVFARAPGWLWRDRLPSRSRNWQLTVPASFEQWQRARSKRDREDTRRYDRRIRKEFGDGIRVELIDGLGDVDRAAALVEQIARKTYQRGMGSGFHDRPDARSRWRAAAVQDALDVRILWLDDRPAAFTVGFLFEGTLWLEYVGYDPAFRRFRAGMFLLHRMIEELSERGNVQLIDFGIGDADYKRRLCDRSREDVSIYLFAPTLRGLWLNGMRTAANGLGSLGVTCLDRLGLLPWFKRRWRRALQPRDSDGDEA